MGDLEIRSGGETFILTHDDFEQQGILGPFGYLMIRWGERIETTTGGRQNGFGHSSSGSGVDTACFSDKTGLTTISPGSQNEAIFLGGKRARVIHHRVQSVEPVKSVEFKDRGLLNRLLNRGR